MFYDKICLLFRDTVKARMKVLVYNSYSPFDEIYTFSLQEQNTFALGGPGCWGWQGKSVCLNDVNFDEKLLIYVDYYYKKEITLAHLE